MKILFILILTFQSSHNFAHVTTAELGKVVAWLDHYFLCNSYTNFYQYLDNELIVTLWNASLTAESS